MKLSITQYRELRRWDVKYASHIEWQWDKQYIRKLGEVLKRKRILYISSPPLPMLSIHFDGTMTERTTNSIKGNMFVANAGDLVYSKIDLRNGAIGIIPDKYDAVGFTSEFSIYKACEDQVDREYIKLVLHSEKFRQYVYGLVSGTSGRKRIDPDSLESIQVPIPPRPIQETIVNLWENAQAQAFEFRQSADFNEKEIEQVVMRELGLTESPSYVQRGPFIVNHNEAERWDTYFFREEFRDILAQLRHIGSIPLGKCAHFVSRRWTPTYFPSGFFRYIQISDVNRTHGIVGSSKVEVKHAPSRAAQIVRQGDIIISTTRPYLAAFAGVSQEFDGSVASSAFSVIDATSEGLDKDFLLLFLKSYAGLKQFEQRMTGGLYPAIVQNELKKLLIPIPPFKKQTSIVEKVGTLQESIRGMKRAADDIIAVAKVKLEAVISGETNVKDVTNG
jgi:type I restriction enzyme S subunit